MTSMTYMTSMTHMTFVARRLSFLPICGSTIQTPVWTIHERILPFSSPGLVNER